MKKRICFVSIIILFSFSLVLLPFTFKINGNKMTVNSKDGIVRLVAGANGLQKINSDDDIFTALDELKDVYGFSDVYSEFVPDKTLNSSYGKVYKFKQVNQGYVVFGRGINVAIGHDGKILSISGNYLKSINISLEHKLLHNDIINILSADYGEISIYSINLEIYSLFDKPPKLVYHVVISAGNGVRVFIDADSGEIVEEIPLAEGVTIPSTPYITTQKDYYGNDVTATIEKTTEPDKNGDYTYVLADALRNIYILDGQNKFDYNGQLYANTTGIFDDGVAISAFLNLVTAFDFYDNPNNIGVSLRGIDGSVNHTHDDAENNNEISVSAVIHYGSQYQNAAYLSGLKEESPNQAVFVFGDGLSTGLYNPAIALDIVGHEYQHAITQYAGGLIYKGASGAINEAISDIFGALIEGHAITENNFWLIGEDADFSGKGATRSIKSPADFGYPSHYNNRRSFYDTYDYGNVHYNSNILSHLQYKMYNAAPAHFSTQNIGKLWYATLQLLAPDSDFSDFRVLMREAATLLGWSQNVLNAIDSSFDSSGILGTAGEHTVTFDTALYSENSPAAITLTYGEEFVIPQFNLGSVTKTFANCWSETGRIDDADVYYSGKKYRMPAHNLILKPIMHASMWNGLTPSLILGSGKKSDPYLISSAQDLATLAYYVNGFRYIDIPWHSDDGAISFRMTADIDLQNVPWIPIGLEDTSKVSMFYGNYLFFDGDGHVIKNLNITSSAFDSTMEHQGLFGYGRGAVISNLGIESGKIDTYARHAGSIAGLIKNSVSNCFSKIDVVNRHPSGYAGGIAGYALLSNLDSVTGCYNTGDVTADYAGGICGRYDWISSGKFGNCYNTGKVTGSYRSGGIIGSAHNISLINCINIGTVLNVAAKTTSAGGMVGYCSGTKSLMIGCKNTGKVGNEYSMLSGAMIGQIAPPSQDSVLILDKNHYKSQEGLYYIGNFSNLTLEQKSKIKGKSPLESFDETFSGSFDFDNANYFSDLNFWGALDGISIFDMGIEWQLNKGAMPTFKKLNWWIDNRAESFAGGDGTSKNPYKIATAQQLALMNFLITKSGLNGYEQANYIMVSDIDLSGYAWNGIGSDKKFFSGTFDGSGFTIKNMSARKYLWYDDEKVEMSYVSTPALFSSVKNNSQNDVCISNLKIENVNSVNYGGNHSFYGVSAALVAMLESGNNGNLTIKNIIAQGVITGTNISSGIVANIENKYNLQSQILIEGCSFKGIASAVYCGGVVGRSVTKSKLTLRANVNEANVGSYFTGYYPEYTFAGGIIGVGNYLEIDNCINLGGFFNIDGSAGGIIGSTNDGMDFRTQKPNIVISGCLQLGQETFYGVSLNIGEIIGYFHNSGASDSKITIKNNNTTAGLPLTPPSPEWLEFVSVNNTTAKSPLDFDVFDIDFFFDSNLFTVSAELSNRLFYLFNDKYITHTVTFLNWDETILSNQVVLHRTAAFSPTQLERDSTPQYSYIFLNWDKDFSAVTQDIIVRAQYKEQVNQYTYTFYDDDGVTVLKTETLDYGAQIIPPENSSKPPSAQYTYQFDKWENYNEEIILTQDFAFTAKYFTAINKYTYTFYDDDEVTVLKTKTADYGTYITAPENPTKSGNAQYTYQFVKWSGYYPQMILTGNISFKPIFFEKLNQYVCTFYDDDGVTVLKTETLDYGAQIIPPENPSKQSTAQYDYIFVGWDTNFNYITNNISIRAQYSSAIRYYTVTFLDGNSIISTLKLKYGSEVMLPDQPEKSGWIFKGWYLNKKFTETFETQTITADIKVFAKFSKDLSVEAIEIIIGTSAILLAICSLAIYLSIKRKNQHK